MFGYKYTLVVLFYSGLLFVWRFRRLPIYIYIYKEIRPRAEVLTGPNSDETTPRRAYKTAFDGRRSPEWFRTKAAKRSRVSG